MQLKFLYFISSLILLIFMLAKPVLEVNCLVGSGYMLMLASLFVYPSNITFEQAVQFYNDKKAPLIRRLLMKNIISIWFSLSILLVYLNLPSPVG